MSKGPQPGRRRAEPVHAPSRRKTRDSATLSARHTAAKAKDKSLSSTTKRMAVVAVAATLLTGGGLAQAATSGTGPSTPGQVTAGQASPAATAVTAPSNIALDFSSIKIGSGTTSTPGKATVKSEANAVEAVPSATPEAAPAAPVVVDDPAAAQAYASGQLAGHGWGADQMSCLSQLWTRESSWLTSAENPSSGAYGIAQSLPAEKMAVTGADYRTNYQTQINWGLSYISGRYGSPCGAWGHSNAVGWY